MRNKFLLFLSHQVVGFDDSSRMARCPNGTPTKAGIQPDALAHTLCGSNSEVPLAGCLAQDHTQRGSPPRPVPATPPAGLLGGQGSVYRPACSYTRRRQEAATVMLADAQEAADSWLRSPKATPACRHHAASQEATSECVRTTWRTLRMAQLKQTSQDNSAAL